MSDAANAALHAACAEQSWNEQQLAQPVLAPAWRVWTYDDAAVVLGCSQRRLLGEAREDTGVELLLRASGGGAVLTGPWLLGLSVAVPAGHALARCGLLESYRWLGELMAGLLREHAGIAAEALPPASVRLAPAPASLQWACFGGLSPWEVVAQGRKIAGLAQVRRRHGVLLVGGILHSRPDWPLLCDTLARPPADAALLARRTTSWIDQGGPPITQAALAGLLANRLRQALLPLGNGPVPAHCALEPA